MFTTTNAMQWYGEETMTFIHIPKIQQHAHCHKMILEIKYTDPELWSEDEIKKINMLRTHLAEYLTHLNYNVTIGD